MTNAGTRCASTRGQTNRLAATLRRMPLVCCLLAPPAFASDILFVGNSFTFAAGTPIMQYRANSVTDLNQNGTGGVPALFKSFAVQAGLDYRVYVETYPGVGIDWHLEHARGKLAQRRWDAVVLQSYSTLDADHPGDPATLVASVKRAAQLFKDKNPKVDIRLVATWSRADQAYPPGGHWHGKPIDAMANDVRAGYDKAAAGAGLANAVIPVGEAWNRAIRTGFADANPFDGIDAGKVDLWGTDHYHASVYGYYLEALTIFGSVTGRDPMSMGAHECAAADLGISPAHAGALQEIAHHQLSAAGVTLSPAPSGAPARPIDCAHLR